MKLLLDGYNILKKIKHSSFIRDSERKKFIQQLTHYAHQKKISIIVVFDGGPYSWPFKEHLSPPVEVVYSGNQESADDYIKRSIDNLQTHHNLMLVSSDRELVKHAHNNHITTLDSYTFSQLLVAMQEPSPAKKSTHQQQSHKLTQSNHADLDTLMQQLTISAAKEVEPLKNKVKSQTLSKKERQLLQKIKKL